MQASPGHTLDREHREYHALLPIKNHYFLINKQNTHLSPDYFK